jgi:hypothetical protein
MTRDQVIKLMTDSIEEYNIHKAVWFSKMSEEDAKKNAEQSRAEITFINSALYDLLVEEGIIVE